MYDQIFKFYSKITTLSSEDKDLLASRLKLIHFKKKDLILKEGQVCNNVYFVNSGILRSYRLVDGVEKTVQFYFNGDYCSSYESFLTQKPGKINIDVLTDVDVLTLDYGQVQELYALSESFNTSGRKINAMLYLEYAQKSNALLTENATTRYLSLMKNRPHVIQNIPSYMIASYLGITPESLSRIRKKHSV